MKYVSATPNFSGAYSAPHENPFLGCFQLTDSQADTLVQHAGFVTIAREPDPEISGSIVTVTPDLKAWEAWKAKQPSSLDLRRVEKEAEISAASHAAIVAGMDVQTSQGAEHFSLQETDQINLTTAYNAILSGAEGYPYHADGALCRMFTAAEITAVSNASIAHKLYHTTLCNHLLTWARRAETVEELATITYAAEGLPDDLASNMAQILAAAQNV